MNKTENLISTGCPANSQQPLNQIVKPIKFPAQPQEWKIVSLRECPIPENMQQCETPDQAGMPRVGQVVDHGLYVAKLRMNITATELLLVFALVQLLKNPESIVMATVSRSLWPSDGMPLLFQYFGVRGPLRRPRQVNFAVIRTCAIMHVVFAGWLLENVP